MEVGEIRYVRYHRVPVTSVQITRLDGEGRPLRDEWDNVASVHLDGSAILTTFDTIRVEFDGKCDVETT